MKDNVIKENKTTVTCKDCVYRKRARFCELYGLVNDEQPCEKFRKARRNFEKFSLDDKCEYEIIECKNVKIFVIPENGGEYPTFREVIEKAKKAGAKDYVYNIIAIDTGHEVHLMNVTGNNKTYTVDQFIRVYSALNPQISYVLSKAAHKELTICLVKSRNHVRQICEAAFRS